MDTMQDSTRFCRRCGLAGSRIGAPCSNCALIAEVEELPDAICGGCQTGNPRGARYCRSCGWELNHPVPRVWGTPVPLPPATPTVHVPPSPVPMPPRQSAPRMVAPKPRSSGCGKFLLFMGLAIGAAFYFAERRRPSTYSPPQMPYKLDSFANPNLKFDSSLTAGEIGILKAELMTIDAQGQVGTRLTIPARLNPNLYGKLKIEIYNQQKTRLLTSYTFNVSGKSNTTLENFLLFVSNDLLFSHADSFGDNNFSVETHLTENTQKVDQTRHEQLMVIRGLNDITAVQSRVTSAGIYFTAKYYFNAQNGQMILHFRNPGTNTLIRALDPLYADVDGNLVLSGQPKTYVSPTFIQNDATLFLPTSVIPRGSKSINVEAAIYDPAQRQYLDTPLTFEVKLAR